MAEVSGKVNGDFCDTSALETKIEKEEITKDNVKKKPSPIDTSQTDPVALGGRLSTSSQQTPRTPSKYDSYKEKEKKIGHRRVDDGGQVTYKKIGTSQIMASIQLGIQQAVGSLAGKPEVDVLIQDFYFVEIIAFPASGSQLTPAHSFSEFKFKVYAPIAFRHFRDLFRIAPDDYMISLCSEPLRELSNPGVSGSIFYLSNDDEFIIKTVQHKEAEFLQKLLPGYYMNLNQNPRTLLPKFFGLYTYQCNAKNIRLIVMNNILPSSIKMHQKYDLKGSTFKRKANKYERQKKSPTFKDLDFIEHHPEGILLEAETYKALIKTIERDCRVLESFKIMDYSLLVGIHNLDEASREKIEKLGKANGNEAGVSLWDGGSEAQLHNPLELTRSKSINRQRLVAHSTAMESIQADAEPIDDEESVPPGGIPARNTKGERLLLFLGVIDILQSYRMFKKIEHTFKSVFHDGDTISVHRPEFYAGRFQKFMANHVFKRIPSPLRLSPSRRRGPSIRQGFRTLSHSDSEAASSSDTHSFSYGQYSHPKFSTASGAIEGTYPAIGGDTIIEEENITSPESGELSPSKPLESDSGKGSKVATSSGVFNLPAVLQDRPRVRYPPPVPPRSPRGSRGQQLSESSLGRGFVKSSFGEPRPPVGCTPPPTWDSTLPSGKSSSFASSHSYTTASIASNTPLPSNSPRFEVRQSPTHVTTVSIQDDRSDIVSVSDVILEPKMNATSRLYVENSGSIGRNLAWTPPLSIEGNTPTWTEGTPSYTESSSSGCLSTPARSLNATALESSETLSSREHEMTHL